MTTPHHPPCSPTRTAKVAASGQACFTALAVATALLTAAPTQAQTRPATAQRNLVPVALELPGGERAALFDASYALVIGASNYRSGWSSLPGVADDVKAVTALLQRNGFEVSTVMDPTRDQLDQALSQFAGRYGAREGNRLLIYFAGHGHTRTSGVSKVGYIVPVDAPDPGRDPGGFITKAYSMGRMEAIAKEIQSRHALFVFDSCFSGTIFRARSAVPDAISDRTARPVRQFITAGDEEQTVPDHSHFRRALERGLGADAEADHNGDGYITGSELGEYLYDQVTNYTRKAQTPRHGKIQDPALDRGDFVFLSLRKPTPSPPPPVVDTELERWTAALRANTEAAYADFLRTYPHGAYASAARNALAAIKPPPPPPPPTEAVGAVWKDCADCPELVGLPSGRFTMGSPTTEAGRDAGEGPARTVTINQRLAVGRYEVTRGQFARFVQASGYKTDAEQNAGGVKGCAVLTGEMWYYTEGRSWRAPGFEQTDEHPVVCVSWNDAQAYVKWLGSHSGKGYRLLSEAEWEYAARAGSSTRYPWGDDAEAKAQCAHANGADATAKAKVPGASGWTVADCDDGHAYTAPVGRFKANAFGLHDMSGNAWEWVQDIWHDNYSGATTDGGARTRGSEHTRRVLRGASWLYRPSSLRSAQRSGITPDGRSNGTGFRVVKVL